MDYVQNWPSNNSGPRPQTIFSSSSALISGPSSQPEYRPPTPNPSVVRRCILPVATHRSHSHTNAKRSRHASGSLYGLKGPTSLWTVRSISTGGSGGTHGLPATACVAILSGRPPRENELDSKKPTLKTTLNTPSPPRPLVATGMRSNVEEQAH